MNMELTLGEKIMLLRKKRNLSQADLANLLNINQSNIAYYENNKYKPRLELIVKLSETFDVSTDFLLKNTNLPKT